MIKEGYNGIHHIDKLHSFCNTNLIITSRFEYWAEPDGKGLVFGVKNVATPSVYRHAMTAAVKKSLSTYPQVLWLTLIYARVDLSSIKAIAHDGVTLQVLVERDGRTANRRRHRSYFLESLPAPLQAFQGLLQLAALFASLLQQSDNGLTARKQLLDHIRMIGVNSSNVAASG